MTQRKLVQVGLGVVVGVAMAYMGLGLWQLGQMDHLRPKVQSRQVGYMQVDTRISPTGIWSRDVRFTLGFAKAFGGKDPFLVMHGAFTPGIRPSIVLQAQKLENSDTQIFYQAHPKIVVHFDYVMRPTQVQVTWDRVTLAEERLGKGVVTADFSIDRTKQKVRTIRLRGQTQDSRTKFENEEVIIGGVNFSYRFSNRPLLFSFFIRGQGDKGIPSLAPVTIGPFRYRFHTRQKTIEQAVKTQSDFRFEAQDFSIRDDFMPPLHIQYKGSFLTNKDVWLPCLGSRIWLGETAISNLEFLPGVCPRDMASDMLDLLQKEGIQGKEQRLAVQWAGGSMQLTGQFQAQETMTGAFAMTIHLDLRRQVAPRGLSKQFTKDVRRYLEGLVQEGVMKKEGAHTYKMALEMAMDENYVLSLRGNGIDFRTVQTEFILSHPSTNPNVMIITAIPEDDYYRGEGMQDFIGALRKVLVTIRDIQWTTERIGKNQYAIYVFAKEGTDMKKLNALLDQELSRIVNNLPKGIDVEMQSNAHAVLGDS